MPAPVNAVPLTKARAAAISAVLIAALIPALAFSGEEHDVRAVVEDFASALADRDYARGCSLMTDSVRAQLSTQSGGGCEAALGDALARLDRRQWHQLLGYADAPVKVSGDRAVVEDHHEGATVLLKSDGEWRIHSTDEANHHHSPDPSSPDAGAPPPKASAAGPRG